MEAKKHATYEDLLNVPAHQQAEIIHGQLFVAPRPSPKHARVQFALSYRVGGPYDQNPEGPGGWVFLDEPELWLSPRSGPEGNYVVPDIAGWRKERFVFEEGKNGITVPPDWVCEIISPSSVRHDRVTKMALYAEYGIPYLWLVDPDARILEAYGLNEGKWTLLGSFAEESVVAVAPFEMAEFQLSHLWL